MWTAVWTGYKHQELNSKYEWISKYQIKQQCCQNTTDAGKCWEYWQHLWTEFQHRSIRMVVIKDINLKCWFSHCLTCWVFPAQAVRVQQMPRYFLLSVMFPVQTHCKVLSACYKCRLVIISHDSAAIPTPECLMRGSLGKDSSSKTDHWELWAAMLPWLRLALPFHNALQGININPAVSDVRSKELQKDLTSGRFVEGRWASSAERMIPHPLPRPCK